MNKKTVWLLLAAVAVGGAYFFWREAKSRGMNSAQLLKAVTTGQVQPAPPLPMGPGGVKYTADVGV